MIFERNRTTKVWSINPWNYRYFVWISFYTRAIVLFRMIHSDDIVDAMIIQKSSESLNITESD